MLLEAVLITALFFAGSAVPAQTLEAFGLHFVAQPFGPAYFGFGHLGGGEESGLICGDLVQLCLWME